MSQQTKTNDSTTTVATTPTVQELSKLAKEKFLLDPQEHKKLSLLFQETEFPELCKMLVGDMNTKYIEPSKLAKLERERNNIPHGVFDPKQFCNFRTETVRMVQSLDMKNNTTLWTTLSPTNFVSFAYISLVTKPNSSIQNLFTQMNLKIGGRLVTSLSSHDLPVLLALHGYHCITETNAKTGETIIQIPLIFDLFNYRYGFPLSTLTIHAPCVEIDINPDSVSSASLTLHKHDSTEIFDDVRVYFMDQTSNMNCNVDGTPTIIPFHHPQQMLYFCFTDDKDQVITDPTILATIKSVCLRLDDKTSLTVYKQGLDLANRSTSLLPGYYFISFSGVNPAQDIENSLNFSKLEAPTFSVKIDNTSLQLSWLGSFFTSVQSGIKKCKLAGYGPNIFKTQSGMGGLVYNS